MAATQITQFMKNYRSFTQKQVEVLEVDDEESKWIKLRISPNAGPYQGGSYDFQIYTTGESPDSLDRILHPNINEHRICIHLDDNSNMERTVLSLLFILHEPGYDDPYGSWNTNVGSRDPYRAIRVSLTGRRVREYQGDKRFIEDTPEILKFVGELEDEEHNELLVAAIEAEHCLWQNVEEEEFDTRRTVGLEAIRIDKAKSAMKQFLNEYESFTDGQVQVIETDQDEHMWAIVKIAPNAGPYWGGAYRFKIFMDAREPTAEDLFLHPNMNSEHAIHMTRDIDTPEYTLLAILFLLHAPEHDRSGDHWREVEAEHMYRTIRVSLSGRTIVGYESKRYVEDDDEIFQFLLDIEEEKILKEAYEAIEEEYKVWYETEEQEVETRINYEQERTFLEGIIRKATEREQRAWQHAESEEHRIRIRDMEEYLREWRTEGALDSIAGFWFECDQTPTENDCDTSLDLTEEARPENRQVEEGLVSQIQEFRRQQSLSITEQQRLNHQEREGIVGEIRSPNEVLPMLTA